MMEIPPLPDTVILMVEVGSTAHGTGIDGGEDHDQLAVVVETPDQVLGLDRDGSKTVMQRTQPEGVRSGPGDIDRTLQSLRRLTRLAASGNPSILMTMWAPVEFSTPIGEELQALGEAFVSGKPRSHRRIDVSTPKSVVRRCQEAVRGIVGSSEELEQSRCETLNTLRLVVCRGFGCAV